MVPAFNSFGIDAKFHHVGLAVDSIDLSLESEISTDPIQNVRVAFVYLNGLCVELIEPLSTSSPISEGLKKGIKLVHICYEVSNLVEAMSECRNYGFHCIAKPIPASAFGGRRIAWVYSRRYGLFELLEKDEGEAK